MLLSIFILKNFVINFSLIQTEHSKRP
jgi:hypothetical protein